MPITANIMSRATDKSFIQFTSIHFIRIFTKSAVYSDFILQQYKKRFDRTNKFEVTTMENSYVNQCVMCTVDQCKHHNQSKNYCSLEAVKIGTHEENPTMCQCTDCQSFEAKSGMQ